MIRLRLLGPVELDASGQPEQGLAEVLHRPKRLALLGYLCLAAPGGFVRRDTLLGVFWPELDQHHARAALNQSLYILRRALGAGALPTRARDEVGLDATGVWCDVAAFRSALREGRLEEALDLYRGPLLDGLYVGGGGAFEEWLAGERSRLQDAAADAARRLAEQAERAGDRAAGIRWARRALALAPLDEDAFRRLATLLEASGEHGAALEASDGFTRLLRQEYEAEPSAETRALIAAIRAGASPAALRAGAPAGIPTAGESGPDAASSARAGERPGRPPAAGGSVPRRRLPAIVGLALVTALGAALVLWPSGASPVPAYSANRVLVLPFRYSGDDEHAFLAEGLVTLLSAALDGAGRLRSVDPHAALALGSASDSGAGDAPHVLAGRLGAGLLVLGDIVEMDGRFRVSARILEVGPAGERLLGEARSEAGSEGLFGAVDIIASTLIAALSGGPDERLAGVAATTTGSLPALKEYLAGEAHLVAGDYSAAVTALQRALLLDSLFALAHYRLSTGASWIGQDSLARASSRAAVVLGTRLAPRDRLLVEAWDAYLSGTAEIAEALYLDILSSYPNELEAWENLGELRFHWKASLGGTVSDARHPFERVLAFSPAHTPALLHLARIAASEGRRQSLDSLLRRLGDTDVGGTPEAVALRGWALNDPEARSRFLAAASTRGDDAAHTAARSLAVHAGDLAAAERATRDLVDPANGPLRRARGHVLRAHLAAARGRFAEAGQELDAMARLQPAWAAEHRAWVLLAPGAPATPAALRAALTALRNAPTYTGRAVYGSPADVRSIHEARRAFLVARLGWELGEGSAGAELETLDAIDGDEADRRQARFLATLLRAQAEARAGRPDAALAVLGEPRLVHRVLPEHSMLERAQERWLRAEMLSRLGRYEEALRWYATFPDPSGYDLVYLVPSLLRRAAIHRARGEPKPAAIHAERAARLRRHAEPGYQPTAPAPPPVPRSRGRR
jgi:DNA-binding SARP family transcriptional activator/Tfp pilus assembly protein PilF/TolB-like protein